MIRKNYLCIIVLLILLSQMMCRSSSTELLTQDDSEAVFHGAVTLIKFNPEIRFAVLDFTDGSGNFTAYGKIIGDETFYRLSALKDIHLLERQKVSAILEEHNLEQSGVVSGSTREQLGRLLQADIIVMGSYIFEGDRIKINGRFTDFKTGEIKGTFAYYLAGPQETAGGSDISKNDESNCEPYEKIIESFMRDLRTPDKVERAVQSAVKIPYSMKCRSIHQDIMSTFARGGLYPDTYKQFLRNSVTAIRDPDEIERKNSVFYYFQSDKKIDEMEWNTGILSMKNANEKTIQRVVYFILNRGESQDEKILLKRIDLLMELANAGAFGKPVTLTHEKMFISIFRIGSPSYTTSTIRLYLLDKYANRLQKDKRNLSYILSYSEKSLVSEKDGHTRAKFYNQIRNLFSSADPEEKNDLALQLIKFINEMHYRYGKEDTTELRTLSLSLAHWFCYSTTQTRRDYRLQSAIGILKKYNIQCGRR